MFSKKTTNIITAQIPDYLIQQRDGGGGKKLSYISGSTVIDILNAAFDYMWDWQIEDYYLAQAEKKFNQYAKVSEDEKVTFNGKKGVWEDQSPIAHVVGTLTVYKPQEIKDAVGNVLDVKYIPIKKTGCGSKVVMGGSSEQESIFKAASTDALKKAASLLGIGAQLYRNEDEAFYFLNELNYENPWTEEEITKHKDENDYINNLINQYSLDESSMVDLIQQCGYSDCTSLLYITPSNIGDIVSKLKEQEAAAEAANK